MLHFAGDGFTHEPNRYWPHPQGMSRVYGIEGGIDFSTSRVTPRLFVVNLMKEVI